MAFPAAVSTRKGLAWCHETDSTEASLGFWFLPARLIEDAPICRALATASLRRAFSSRELSTESWGRMQQLSKIRSKCVGAS